MLLGGKALKFWARELFGGQKTLLWLLLPASYFVYFVFFTRPFTFSTTRGAWFLDPMVDYPLERRHRGMEVGHLGSSKILAYKSEGEDRILSIMLALEGRTETTKN